MSVGYINDTTLTGIANAIREKNGESGLYLPSEMAAKIAAIEGSGTIEPLSVTENGTYTAPEGTDGYSPVTVNVSGGEARIYGDTYDPDYYMDSADLICTLSGRAYTKTTADPAYVAYFYDGSIYTRPLLVSETEDGAKFTSDGSVYSQIGTITYNGKMYYCSSWMYAMRGNNASTSGFAQKLDGTYASFESAAEALLNIAIVDPYYNITENGSYPVPEGYDGYGDLTVNVDIESEEYTHAETMDILGGEWPLTSNLNLVSNWDFSQPILENGVPKAWDNVNSGSLVTVVDGGIKLSRASSDQASFYALRTNSADVFVSALAGLDITFSALVDDVFGSITFTFPASISGTLNLCTLVVSDITFRIYANYTTNRLELTTINVDVGNENKVIKAVKVEVGSQQTLYKADGSLIKHQSIAEENLKLSLFNV